MKTFKQYISEDLDDIQSYTRSAWGDRPTGKLGMIPGLINPSREQLQGFLNKVHQARFILHKDILHVFDARDAIHDDVLRAEHPDQNDPTKDFFTRKNEMYRTQKSVLGSFHSQYDHNNPEQNTFVVGLSYMTRQNNKWMVNLLRSHPRTAHLIQSNTKIEPWDM